MVKIIRGRKPMMTEPGEMYLGTVTVDGLPYPYASDPTICAVFCAGRWFSQRWDTPSFDRFHGNVEQAATHLANIHKIGVVG